MRLASSGAWQKGALEFQRAVAIDSDFSEAHGNLGAAYSALGLFDQAASEFRRAIELDPAAGIHHGNLAYALIRLGQWKAAEPEAAAAVALDPADANGQYLLGFLLANRVESRARAAEHLRFAARQFPEAHLVLANLYSVEGAGQSAALELDEYRKATADRRRQQ